MRGTGVKRSGRNAWVGIFPADDQDFIKVDQGQPLDAGTLLEKGILQLATSIEDKGLLHWEA